MGVQGSQQIQGNSFTTNYSILFLTAIGVTDTYLNLVYLILVNTVSAAAAFYLADKLGRRWFMILGGFIEAIMMYIVAGLTGGSTTSPAQEKGALAMLFLWQAFQACSWVSW
jgi:MFS family permease